MGHEEVRFSGAKTSLFGVAAGTLIALGVPYLVLVYGQFLGPGVVTLVLLGALIVGGGIALVAAFFGAVMPVVVRDNSNSANDAKTETEKKT